MKLIECYIENFGKLSAQKIKFNDGINCIKGDNGSGKTTLAAFIKVMLYGMSDTKKTSLEENDRKHYLPWNGGPCGGSLIFSIDRKTYRVQRSFAPKAADDSFVIYDTATGRECQDYSENLGAEIFGIDADGFERTVFLSERYLSPKSENKTISAKLSDLVGCNGDIGEMDSALKNLDNQRKFYHKKGGAGEINDIKAKITEINKKLDTLAECEVALGESARKVKSLAYDIEIAKNESVQLINKRESVALKVADDGYADRCKEMQQALEMSIKKRERLFYFFSGIVPTFSEIDEMAYKYTEARNLMNDNSSGEQQKKYSELSNFFKGKVTADDIEKTKAAVAELKELNTKRKSPVASRARELFSRRIPSKAELDRVSLLLNQKSKKHIGLYILSAILCLGGAVTGAIISLPFFAICGAGVVLALLTAMISAGAKKKTQKEINAFLSSVSHIVPSGQEEQFEMITEMSSLIEVAEGLPNENEAKRIEEELKSFNIRFGIEGGDIIASAERIIDKYGELAVMTMAEKYMKESREDKAERASRLRREAQAFLARYKTVSTDPFGEIRNALTEYNRLSADITERGKELSDLQNRRELGEDEVKKARAELIEIDRARSVLEDKIASLNRDYTLAERACQAYSEELEARDELNMRLLDLEEALAKNKENYEVVLLTKKYLSVAHENMTSRYIGKTRERFLKYTEIISGKKEEAFEMDTDFGVSKIEGASTKTVDAYSRGTQDLYNLASRLALIDSLYEEEQPFIILDDPFTALDDSKTKAALRLLSAFAKERQIIYFTCSQSRAIGK